MLYLDIQRADMIGELCERMRTEELREFQNLLNAPLEGEEYCEFIADESGEFEGLEIVGEQEFWERFCESYSDFN